MMSLFLAFVCNFLLTSVHVSIYTYFNEAKIPKNYSRLLRFRLLFKHLPDVLLSNLGHTGLADSTYTLTVKVVFCPIMEWKGLQNGLQGQNRRNS
jgi:hypothetical protein